MANLMLYFIGLLLSLVAFPIGPVLWTILCINLTKKDREVYKAKYRKCDYQKIISLIKINIDDNLRKGINIFDKTDGVEGLYQIGDGCQIYERDRGRIRDEDYNYNIGPYVFPNAKIVGKRDPKIMSKIYDEWYPIHVKKYQNISFDDKTLLKVNCDYCINRDTNVIDNKNEKLISTEQNNKQVDLNLKFNKKNTDVTNYVYISENGKKFHSQSYCGKSAKMIAVQKEYAESKDYTPCKRCYNDQ